MKNAFAQSCEFGGYYEGSENEIWHGAYGVEWEIHYDNCYEYGRDCYPDENPDNTCVTHYETSC